MAVEEKLVARIGHDFELEVPSNPTTGYSVEPLFDQRLFHLESSEYEQVSQHLGATGKVKFKFTPLKKGRSHIKILYKRPWEQEAKKEMSFLLTVEE